MFTESQINELAEQLIDGDIWPFMEKNDLFLPLNHIWSSNFCLQNSDFYLQKHADNSKIRLIFHEDFAEILYHADKNTVERVQVDAKLNMKELMRKPLMMQHERMIKNLNENHEKMMNELFKEEAAEAPSPR